jgi:23S rRNA pseudouridine1911/1915/1917 synthase
MLRRLLLPPTASGRLDRALADQLGLGRATVKRAFSLGEVRVNGRRARAADPAEPGAPVEIEVEGPTGPPAPQPDLPLRVLAESARLVLVDKPAGVAVHPLSPGEGGTLANAVAARYPECALASPAPREGGALHRLDVETSGCVAFARDREAWELVHPRLSGGGEVDKRYRALLVGRLAAGGVSSVPLAQRGGRVVPVPDALAEDRLRGKGFRPRPAETRWEVERRTRDHTLVAVHLLTGVMHQIRAHLAHLGHPVAGDALYGGAAAALPGLARHFLHASRLSVSVPGLPAVEAESPLPPELQRVLDGLPAEVSERP